MLIYYAKSSKVYKYYVFSGKVIRGAVVFLPIPLTLASGKESDLPACGPPVEGCQRGEYVDAVEEMIYVVYVSVTEGE